MGTVVAVVVANVVVAAVILNTPFLLSFAAQTLDQGASFCTFFEDRRRERREM